MNFRLFLLICVICLIGWFCDDQPTICADKFDTHYYIIGELDSRVRVDTLEYEQNPESYENRINIYRMRYLPEWAFNREKDYSFKVENCPVTVQRNSEILTFTERKPGMYCWVPPTVLDFIHPGDTCKLKVILPDGHEATSQFITNNIYGLEDKDTLYVRPDSVLLWGEVDWNNIYPIQVSATYSDTIHFQVSEGSFIRNPISDYGQYISYSISGDDSNRLWLKMDRFENHLVVYSAARSPQKFLSDHPIDSLILNFSVEYGRYREIQQIIWSVDNAVPVERISEVSNIDGALGFFYPSSYLNNQKKYILKCIP